MASTARAHRNPQGSNKRSSTGNPPKHPRRAGGRIRAQMAGTTPVKSSDRSYTARCEWDRTGWWTVSVDGVPGALTQSRRLDQVPDDVAEVLRLMTGDKPGEYSLEIQPVLPSEAGEAAEQARAFRVLAEEWAMKSSEATDLAVDLLHGLGLTMRDTARLTGISHQRVNQLLSRNRS